jgi:hypothetical protein
MNVEFKKNTVKLRRIQTILDTSKQILGLYHDHFLPYPSQFLALRHPAIRFDNAVDKGVRRANRLTLTLHSCDYILMPEVNTIIVFHFAVYCHKTRSRSKHGSGMKFDPNGRLVVTRFNKDALIREL